MRCVVGVFTVLASSCQTKKTATLAFEGPLVANAGLRTGSGTLPFR